tara:strand:- start:567 stop:773 length:207 start_codon:yes stop_codon:yes gene_type:complete
LVTLHAPLKSIIWLIGVGTCSCSVAAAESMVAMIAHTHGVVLAVPMWTLHTVLQNLFGLFMGEIMDFK